MDLKESEIDVGLAVHLDPDTLEKSGATFTCKNDLRVQGGHMFLCVEALATRGRWIPLFSNSGKNRQLLPASGRSGHRWWLDGTFHYHLGQVWSAPHCAVIAAAITGNEKSTRELRNLLEKHRVPALG